MEDHFPWGPTGPEPARHLEMYMASKALSIMAPHLANRYGVGAPTVVLALFLAAFGSFAGTRTCSVMLYSSNRMTANADAAVGTFALVETIVFIVLLMVAFVYVWRRGALEWR